MKKTLFPLILALAFTLQGAAMAAVVVTVGKITGVNTELDVTVEGSGTIGVDPLHISVYPLPGGSGGGVNTSDVQFFSEAANNDIGDIVSSTYNYYAVLLSSPITMFNTTDATTDEVEYLLFNHDPSPGIDNFQLLLLAPDSFLEPGDSWSISGHSAISLGRGDSSDFNLGTYSYTDGSVGDVTLILQSNPAVIPETSTALSIIIGGVLLMAVRRKKSL